MRIDVRDLTKQFRRSGTVLEQVDLTLDRGTTGLLGANGAGKTTLLRILAGVLRPSSGTVTVGPHDLATAAGRRAVRRGLGYLPQEVSFYPDLTGREMLDYIALLKEIDRPAERRAQVGELIERVALEQVADRRVGTYSGGMKRRLGIAQALLGSPSVVIVDEPTAGLDPHERMRFRSLLAEVAGSRVVLLSTHILDDVSQTCPAVAVLVGGRIAYEGSTAGLRNAATGRTWAVTAPSPPATGVVVSATAGPSGAEYRVVTDDPPPGALLATPTLEDGYAALQYPGRKVAR